MDTVFEGNTTPLDQYSGGGAIVAWFAGDVIVEGCTFERNRTVEGGALFVFSETVGVTGCYFTLNVGRYAATTIPDAPAVVTDCTFTSNAGGGLDLLNGATVTGCVFARNNNESWGGGAFSGAGPADFVNCTFTDNRTALKGGAVSLDGGNLTLFDTLHVREQRSRDRRADPHRGWGGCHAHALDSRGGTGAGGAVVCDPGGTVTATCSDVFGNADGDYVACLSGQDGANGNFSEDPGFCDEDAGEYGLRSNSPCAPPGLTACGLIGAQPVTCGPVSVEATVESATWGQVKSWYR